MENAEQILVVILSGMLALFLLIGIVALVKIVQILKHIKRLTEKAEQMADKAEAVTEFFEATAGPAAIAKLVGNIVGAMNNKGNKKR